MNLKFPTLAAGLLLTVDICLADRLTLDETKTQFALPMSTPPTIDGDIVAGEWQYAAGASGDWKIYIVTVTDPDGNPMPVIRGGAIGDAGIVPVDNADLSYSIYVGYDANNLYVAVRVTDNLISTDDAIADTANGNTWMDDSVEVFIDGDNSNFPTRDTSGTNPEVVGTGGQYVITANNAYREAEAGNPGYGEDAAWFARTGTRADGTGYDAEFRISLATIGSPNPGDIIGFTVGVNDDDDGAGGERQVVWVGLPHTEARYGNLIIGQKSYTAPKAPAAPTIDGIINLEEYPGAEEIQMNGTRGNWELDGLADGFPPEDLSYRAWVIYDADAMYVAVDVVDDQVFADTALPGSEDGSTWEDDSVEIFFDPNNSKNLGRSTAVGAGQYVYTAAGAWRDTEANNPTFGENADWFAQTTRTLTGYQVEFKVTRSVLQAPADGGSMGFNIGVNDDDGANRKSQLNWDGRPHREYTYGQLVLGGQGLVITKIELVGNSVKLTFSSPNPTGTHAVQSKSALSDAQWNPVAGVSFAPGVGTDLTATFAKPAGTTQFYRLSVQ